MAHNPNPNDPFVSPDDPYLTTRPDNMNRASRLDDELQPDRELAEGPASSGKVAMFAVAIAIILGVVFYGLNNSTINQAGTATTAQNSAPSTPPPAPPGMRDVTPRANNAANNAPGTTTGAAPASPQTAPSPVPAGQDVNRSANPPANNMPASK
jgi:hypothetical protein